MARRAHIRLRTTQSAEDATVSFVVGDTFMAAKSGSPPVKNWLRVARQKAPAPTSVFEKNFGIPGHSSPDFIEGVFADTDHRLIYGIALIHWNALAHGVGDRKVCAVNFLEHLVWMFSLAVEDRFQKQFFEIEGNARARIGSEDVAPASQPRIQGQQARDSARDIRNLIRGTYFCSQFVENSQLATCARAIAELISIDSR
jgi:hypothetical protein